MRIRGVLAGLAACSIALRVGAMPPEQFRALQHEYEQAWAAIFVDGPATFAEMFAVRKAAVGSLEMSGLTARQIAWLYDNGLLKFGYEDDQTGAAETIDHTDEAVARLETLATGADLEGAAALATIAAVRMPSLESVEARAALVSRALEHPMIVAAMRVGSPALFVGAFRHYLGDEGFSLVAADALALARAFASSEAIEPAAARTLEAMYRVAKQAVGEERAGEVEDVRLGLLRLGNQVLEDGVDELDANMARYLREQLEALEMAPQVDRLVGGPAPALTILWSSGEPMSSLEDLRGKVVVLDFWATWCAPCIASFPNVGRLVERYEGYPVVVLGVTSPQGGVTFRGERGAVRAETPEAEFALMADYIDAMEMTWTVVFTEQSVVNPEYGVRGIPHMTIIGPDGKVAANNLHPAQPLADKAAIIDPLLEQAGLPRPAALPEGDEG